MVGKPPNVHTNDHAPTLAVAKAQFEAAWRQWLAWAKLLEMHRAGPPPKADKGRITNGSEAAIAQ